VPLAFTKKDNRKEKRGKKNRKLFFFFPTGEKKERRKGRKKRKKSSNTLQGIDATQETSNKSLDAILDALRQPPFRGGARHKTVCVTCERSLYDIRRVCWESV